MPKLDEPIESGEAIRGPRFTATYRSECSGSSPDCLLVIEPGDLAGFRDGVAVCSECYECQGNPVVHRTGSICPGCQFEVLDLDRHSCEDW